MDVQFTYEKDTDIALGGVGEGLVRRICRMVCEYIVLKGGGSKEHKNLRRVYVARLKIVYFLEHRCYI